MARTPMTIGEIPGSFVGAVLDISAPHAFDQPNGMSAPASGDIVFRVQNPTVGSISLTVASTPVAGRSDTFLQAHALAAGADVVLPLFTAVGWEQAADALLHFDASATGLTYQALRLPAGQ